MNQSRTLRLLVFLMPSESTFVVCGAGSIASRVVGQCRACLGLLRGCIITFRWHNDVFCIPAIEIPAHATHSCSDNISRAKFATGCFLNYSTGLNAEDTWELNTGTVSLASEELRAIEACGADADEDLVFFCNRDGALFDFEDGGVAGGVHHYGFHGGHPDVGGEV